MLSFFAKKKSVVENPLEQQPPIQGPREDNNDGDGFIFVERSNAIYPPTNTVISNNAVYPPIPNAPGCSYKVPYPYTSKVDKLIPVPYLQGVPFLLSPNLTDNKNERISIEIDRILAILTRHISMDEENNEYDFNLEKSILNAM